MICPICKREKYIATGCSKCFDCSREALKKALEENPALKKAIHDSVEATKAQIPSMVKDTIHFADALKQIKARNHRE